MQEKNARGKRFNVFIIFLISNFLFQCVFGQQGVSQIPVGRIGKEGFKHFKTLCAQYAGYNLHRAVFIQRVQAGQVAAGAAAHDIFISVNDSADPRYDQSAVAHQAGFHRDEGSYSAPIELIFIFGQTPQNNHFGVVDFIAAFSGRAHAGAGDQDFIPASQHTTHRKLAGRQGLLGLLQSFSHKILVIHIHLVD